MEKAPAVTVCVLVLLAGLLLPETYAATTPATTAACPAPAQLNVDGLCLCPFDQICNDSTDSNTCNIGYVYISNGFWITTVPVHYFEPTCENCQCAVPTCPDFTITDGDGDCRCVKDTAEDPSDYGSACQGSQCYRTRSRESGSTQVTYIDWFKPTCTDCQCVACPEGTFKDSDGDCQCPGHEFCIGSEACRESEATTTETFLGETIQVGDHIHYWTPPCTDCRCDSTALNDFTKVERKALTGVNEVKQVDHVAAKCAEICLDNPACLSFESGRGRQNGECYIQLSNRDSPGATLEDAADRDYYERIDAPDPCDINNGDCGDEKFVRCVFVNEKLCQDINECQLDNGGCADGQTCINHDRREHECVDETTGAPNPCDADPCGQSGTCVYYQERECVCTDDAPCACESPYECVTTCDDNPCDANAECENAPVDDKGRVTGYQCTCKDGFVADPDRSDCRAKTACDEDNGGCGDNASCFVDGDGPVECTCNTGFQGDGCSEPICKEVCQNGGSCAAPGEDCECPGDFSGPTCSDCDGPSCPSFTCDQSCENGSCIDGACVCDDSTQWTGNNCNQAVCADGCDTTNGFCAGQPGECLCKPGYGPEGVCDDIVCRVGCQNGGCDNNPGGCDCERGFIGELCDRCDVGYDVVGGSCEPKCGDGIILAGIEDCDDKNSVDGDGCSSTCFLEDGYQCLGEPSTCSDIDGCKGMPCGDNAVCLDVKAPATGHSCECKPGFNGDPKEDGSGCVPECTNGRVWTVCGPSCTETCDQSCQDSAATVCNLGQCVCPDDKKVWDEANQQCVSECTSAASADCQTFANGPNGKGCENGGICHDEVSDDNSFTCDCSATEYQGDNCDIYDPDINYPEYGPNGKDCENNARRIDVVRNDGNFECSCTAGFVGDNCENADCSSAGDCDALFRLPCSTLPNTCGNCKDGYTGIENSNTKCQELTESSSFYFTIFMNFAELFGNPIRKSRKAYVTYQITRGFQEKDNTLDFNPVTTTYSPGSVIVTMDGPAGTIDQLVEIVKSGITFSFDGRDAESCIVTSENSCETPTTTAVPTSQATPDPQRSLDEATTADPGSDGVSVGLVAGVIAAIAAIAIIAIVVVVIVRRRGDGHAPVKTGREVVSFTSPGYVDDGLKGGAAFTNPIYNENANSASMYAEADNTDAFYSEPKMNPRDSVVSGVGYEEFPHRAAGPMYDTAEGQDEMDDGGYMDVAPLE